MALHYVYYSGAQFFDDMPDTVHYLPACKTRLHMPNKVNLPYETMKWVLDTHELYMCHNPKRVQKSPPWLNTQIS